MGVGERDSWIPRAIPTQPHVSSCGHVLHARCWRKYVDNVLDKENRRPYRVRQPAAFDVEKKEYLCPLCERLCNTALPLLPGPSLPPGAPPPLSEECYADSVNLILKLKHQVSSESVHICTEFCEDILCQARARSVGAMSSDMEEEFVDEAEVYVSTHSENLLPAEFLAHFEGEIPDYNEITKVLIEDFANMLPLSEGGGMSASASLYRGCAYTVLGAECVLRAESRPLLGELPARLRDALQAVLRLAAALPALWREPRHLAHHALCSLATLETSSPLSHEPFSVLVALVLTIPSLFCRRAGVARPANLARRLALQTFRAVLTRALITLDLSSCCRPEEPLRPDLENLISIVYELRRGRVESNLSANAIWEAVKHECHGFLRCCCLFFYFLSDINPPVELTVHGGDTWEAMCGYLDLPSTFKELLETPLARKKANEWAALSNDWFEGEIPPHEVRIPKEPPRLIALPEDFSELMNIVSEFSCPNSEREDSKNPTMCLVCGRILCSQSYCCQAEISKRAGVAAGASASAGAIAGAGGGERVGAVVWHAAACGAGAGVFLRVRDCELLLVAAPAHGAKLPAPYLDSYGETDQGLRRGNPLKLCPERYEKLRMLWLSHGLYEKIARALDTNMLVTTTWQNL